MTYVTLGALYFLSNYPMFDDNDGAAPTDAPATDAPATDASAADAPAADGEANA